MPRKDDTNKKYHSKNERSNSNRPKVNSGINSVEDLYNAFDSALWGDSYRPRELSEAQALSFASGLPIIGGLFSGFQQARYMDDYYKNTGMVPKYPGYNMSGYSGIGRALGNLALNAIPSGGAGYRVKEGTHNLLSFYNYAYQ